MPSVPRSCDTDVLVIGAGIIGIAVAYSIKMHSPDTRVTLLDSGAPMAWTSAQSGENYRNWWPQPVMKRFVEHSIELMESLVLESEGRINLSRSGYALATRSGDVEALLAELATTHGEGGGDGLRIHERESASSYRPGNERDAPGAASGVDVLRSGSLVRRHFPTYDPAIETVLHVRQAGTVSSQPLGQHMLERFRSLGGQQVAASLVAMEAPSPFSASIRTAECVSTLRADRVVNAAGPFAGELAAMLGKTLPVHNVLQQKIAFEDTARAIPRNLPFSIDLDAGEIGWSDEEKASMNDEPAFARFLGEMPGGTHCRPEGGASGTWIKLGWAYNDSAVAARREPELDDVFPEIVLRGASRLQPALKAYADRFPRNMTHYGGFYTMTEENWPLIGPLGVDGAFVAGAMSGFGTMAACAAGDLTARWVLGRTLPDYASALSLQRYEDAELMAVLRGAESRGLL